MRLIVSHPTDAGKTFAGVAYRLPSDIVAVAIGTKPRRRAGGDGSLLEACLSVWPGVFLGLGLLLLGRGVGR